MVPLPPLDSPQTLLWTRLPSVARLNGGLRGLGSGRLSAYMQLSCPEFRLRGLPRITVRGQTVQGGSVAFCIEDAGTGENVNLCLRIEKMCFCIEENLSFG